MPEYDVTNYPEPLAPNLTGGEVGREPSDLPARWPAARHIPDPHDGAVPSREWETNASHIIKAEPVPPVKPPVEKDEPSISPPPA